MSDEAMSDESTPRSMQPGQRFDRRIRVQRAEQQVSGLRGAKRHFGGLLVANLAHHDDFRVVPEERAQVGREGIADLGVDFRLTEAFVDVFNRVLGSEDADLRPVQVPQAGMQRRGFP